MGVGILLFGLYLEALSEIEVAAGTILLVHLQAQRWPLLFGVGQQSLAIAASLLRRSYEDGGQGLFIQGIKTESLAILPST